MPELRCTGCNLTPNEIDEYWADFTGTDLTPDEYVWQEEGTLNRETGRFACTSCYIKMGMPSSPRGWTA